MKPKKEKTACVDQDKETHCNCVGINKKNKTQSNTSLFHIPSSVMLSKCVAGRCKCKQA
jgi:hypothetical protein